MSNQMQFSIKQLPHLDNRGNHLSFVYICANENKFEKVEKLSPINDERMSKKSRHRNVIYLSLVFVVTLRVYSNWNPIKAKCEKEKTNCWLSIGWGDFFLSQVEQRFFFLLLVLLYGKAKFYGYLLTSNFIWSIMCPGNWLDSMEKQRKKTFFFDDK